MQPIQPGMNTVQFQGIWPKRKKEQETPLIQLDSAGVLKVPSHVEIPVIEGDGIGKEIMGASQRVIDEAVQLAYGKKRAIEWMPVSAGEKALAEGKALIPEETKQAIDSHHIAVKGPLNTPIGKGYRSINVELRDMFKLYANIRPIKSLPEVVTPVKHQNIDTVIFRENTEDVYRGIEFEKGSKDALDLIDFLKKKGIDVPVDSGIGVKPISETASKRIITDAIQYALDNNRKSVTVVHKGNIQKFTEGAFWNYAKEVAKDQFPDSVISQEEFWDKDGPYKGDLNNLPAGKVILKDRIADAMFQDVILNPHAHEVVVTTNLNGDYLSDAFASLVGGIGLAPGANIGDKHAIFEAVHGTAPDIAGQGKANPTALILSMKMMLDHIGWGKAADLVQQTVEKTLSQQQMTGDLSRHIKGTKALSTNEFVDSLLANMQTLATQTTEQTESWTKKLTGLFKRNTDDAA